MKKQLTPSMPMLLDEIDRTVHYLALVLRRSLPQGHVPLVLPCKKEKEIVCSFI